MNRQKINDGVYLNEFLTDKFSTSALAITFVKPISEINPSSMAILPFVLLNGCQKYKTLEEIHQKLDSLYGAKIEPIVRKKGEFLCITFVCDFICSKYAKNEDLLSKIYDILNEIVFNPLIYDGYFKEEIVSFEKQNLINKINASKNDKRVYANNEMIKIMCKNEPFAINTLGTVENCNKITAKNLFEFYTDLIKTANIEIFYCGNENIKNLSFNHIEKRAEISPKYTFNIEEKNVKEVIKQMDISQGKLSLGFRTEINSNDKDYPALVLFNTIFGGSTTSKLFENVREKMSLCYYASSGIRKYENIISVNSGIDVKDFEIAKTAILKQFDDIKAGEFTNDDIESAKLTVINNLKTAKDSKYDIEDYYLGNSLYSGVFDIDTLIKELEKVSKNQIIDASKKVKLDTIYFLKGDETDVK